MRVEYEMTAADRVVLIKASQPVTYIVVGGVPTRSPQENANMAWAALGRKMGFDSATVRPVKGKGKRFFTAVSTQPDVADDD